MGPFAIKVTNNKDMTEMDLLDEKLNKAKETVDPVCFYPKAHKQPHNARWGGVKEDMHYSKWKLNAVAELIRGKPLIEAKNMLAGADKKGAKFIGELIDEIEARGIKRGRNPEQMYVRTITVGGNYLLKKPDIKGRGRTGLIRKPVCSMRIVFEEKSQAEFFKMMVKGETPAGVSALFRRMIYQNKGDFEHVRLATHMLTSNGRRYRRVQFRRLVQKV